MTTAPLVTIVTPATGHPRLGEAIASVAGQSYQPIQHLIVVDGLEREAACRPALEHAPHADVLVLPYPTGKGGFLGHRIYGASMFLAKGELVSFLDEDNWIAPNHISALAAVIARGNDWAYSYRNILRPDGQFACRDDCESLGRWPGVLGDHLVDVNCYLFKKMVGVRLAAIWYRSTRVPGMMEADRLMTRELMKGYPAFDTSGEYSVNYLAGNTELSVRVEFFERGNAEMLARYQGRLPWRAAPTSSP